MKSERILLAENDAIYNNRIQYEQLKVANAQKLLVMLDHIGLTFTEVEKWCDVEQAIKKDYPKASVLFNTQAAGIEEQYREVQAFYIKNEGIMSFKPFTDEQIEDIKECCRVYAESPAQIEAYGLFQTVVDSLKRLSELGVKLHNDELYQVSRVFAGGDRHLSLQVNERERNNVIMNLK